MKPASSKKEPLEPHVVLKLRLRYQAGDSISALALWCGRNRRSVRLALTGETHAHVPGPLMPIQDPSKRKIITGDLINVTVALYLEGRTMKEIAAHFGWRDPRAVQRVLRKRGKEMRAEMDARQVEMPPLPSYGRFGPRHRKIVK